VKLHVIFSSFCFLFLYITGGTIAGRIRTQRDGIKTKEAFYILIKFFGRNRTSSSSSGDCSSFLPFLFTRTSPCSYHETFNEFI
jgi:hypothetical protein